MLVHWLPWKPFQSLNSRALTPIRQGLPVAESLPRVTLSLGPKECQLVSSGRDTAPSIMDHRVREPEGAMRTRARNTKARHVSDAKQDLESATALCHQFHACLVRQIEQAQSGELRPMHHHHHRHRCQPHSTAVQLTPSSRTPVHPSFYQDWLILAAERVTLWLKWVAQHHSLLPLSLSTQTVDPSTSTPSTASLLPGQSQDRLRVLFLADHMGALVYLTGMAAAALQPCGTVAQMSLLQGCDAICIALLPTLRLHAQLEAIVDRPATITDLVVTCGSGRLWRLPMVSKRWSAGPSRDAIERRVDRETCQLRTSIHDVVHAVIAFLDRIHRAELLLHLFHVQPVGMSTNTGHSIMEASAFGLMPNTQSKRARVSITPWDPLSLHDDILHQVTGQITAPFATTSTKTATTTIATASAKGRRRSLADLWSQDSNLPTTHANHSSTSIRPQEFTHVAWAAAPADPDSEECHEPATHITLAKHRISHLPLAPRPLYPRLSADPDQGVEAIIPPGHRITPRLARRLMTRQVSLPPPYDEIMRKVDLLQALDPGRRYDICDDSQVVSRALLHLPRPECPRRAQ